MGDFGRQPERPLLPTLPFVAPAAHRSATSGHCIKGRCPFLIWYLGNSQLAILSGSYYLTLPRAAEIFPARCITAALRASFGPNPSCGLERKCAGSACLCTPGGKLQGLWILA